MEDFVKRFNDDMVRFGRKDQLILRLPRTLAEARKTGSRHNPILVFQSDGYERVAEIPEMEEYLSSAQDSFARDEETKKHEREIQRIYDKVRAVLTPGEFETLRRSFMLFPTA